MEIACNHYGTSSVNQGRKSARYSSIQVHWISVVFNIVSVQFCVSMYMIMCVCVVAL